MRMLPDLIDGGSYNGDQDDSGCSDESEDVYFCVRTPHPGLPAAADRCMTTWGQSRPCVEAGAGMCPTEA